MRSNAGPHCARSASSARAGAGVVGGQVEREVDAPRGAWTGRGPTRSHAPSSARPSSANRSGDMYAAFHPSPCSATSGRVRFGPVPPIQIGSRACTGAGRHEASSTEKCSPANVVRSSVSRPRMIVAASSSIAARAANGGNG